MSNPYSFGDSTTFPLNENFLETIMATVRASSALFRCECELEQAQSTALAAREAADAELRRVEELERQLQIAMADKGGTTCAQVVRTLLAHSARLLQTTRENIGRNRELAQNGAAAGRVTAQVENVLSRFWLSHQLPGTQWSYHWRIGQDNSARAELRAATNDISANFIARPEGEDFWSSEIAVSSLVSSLDIQIPIWTRRCRGTRTKAEDLSDYRIIEFESSQSRRRFVLRRGGKTKHALLITLSDAAQPYASVCLIDEQCDVFGDRHQVSDGDLRKLSELWGLVQEHADTLIKARSELGTVTIDNRNTQNIDQPAEIAETLLRTTAPLIKELRLRSRIPGELILKRQTSVGRREEFFVSREALQAEYGSLPEKHRRIFDAMGLGDECTRDFVTMICEEQLPKPGRQRSQRVGLDSAAALDQLLVDIEAA